MIPYKYSVNRDSTGRIVKKTETINGRNIVWEYSYDTEGRLQKAHMDGRLICQCDYDKEGRRMRDYFPASISPYYREYTYTSENRLLRAGNDAYTHDDNGFRSIWNTDGDYMLYTYSPDYRLLKMEVEDQDKTISFEHDTNGQRSGKFINGELAEAYKWLDFTRLAGFHDGMNSFEFAYQEDSHTPYAMRRDDGFITYLFCDQIGSLRAVADLDGNMIREITYDPFGGIIEDTNPSFQIPIGFAGGLHDRDLGFVRFGWRDYDTRTGRWTAPDPIGDKGGDSDWYGYCLDDPVNGVDPLGLFRFGKRGLGPLPLLGIFSDNPLDDKMNTEIAHEHGFYEDGTGDNVGLFKGGVRHDTEDIQDYKIEENKYDDKKMRRAMKSLGNQEYNILGFGGKKNNCQDYADKMRSRYNLFERGDRQR